MKLMITARRARSESLSTQLQQFLESPHRRPGPGVKMLARWFSPTFDVIYVVVETDDARLISEWLLHWTDFATHDITPVIEDADVAQLLAK